MQNCHCLTYKLIKKNPLPFGLDAGTKNKCVDLHAANEVIHWSHEAKYLGMCILSGLKFKCSFEKAKGKYYRAANAILARIGNNNNKPVTLKLISSIALPILMYSLEALPLNKSELISLNHPWIWSFEKLFNTFDKNVVKQCQFYCGYFNVNDYYVMNSMNFLSKLSSSPNLIVRTIHLLTGREDLYRLSNLYKSDSDIFTKHYKEIIQERFKEET